MTNDEVQGGCKLGMPGCNCKEPSIRCPNWEPTRPQEIETDIDGYTVEITLYTEGNEPRSDCSVSKGKFTSSLARLEDTGTLYHTLDKCDDHKVPPRTIERISKWAEENGY